MLRRAMNVMPVLLIAGILIGLGSSAWATTVLGLNWQEMVERSSIIVTGTVVESHSHWNADKTKIYTTSAVEVSEVLKGQAGKTVLIRQLGGEVDGVGARLLGAPKYEAGEDVVVFLESRPDGAFVTVGLSQGKCRLLRDGKSGARLVERTEFAQGVHVVKRSSQKPEKPENLRVIPMSDLLGIIERHQAK